MTSDTRKRLLRSLIISFIYVGLGTIAVLGVYPSSPFNAGLLTDWGIFFTFPVTFVSFGIAFADSSAHQQILIVQLIVFFLFWAIIYFTLSKDLEKYFPKVIDKWL